MPRIKMSSIALVCGAALQQTQVERYLSRRNRLYALLMIQILQKIEQAALGKV